MINTKYLLKLIFIIIVKRPFLKCWFFYSLLMFLSCFKEKKKEKKSFKRN